MEDVRTLDSLYGFEYREEDKRRVPTEERVVNIKSLWQKNHEIINLSVRGFSNVEIAEILNITPQTVSNTINSDLGKHKLSELRGDRDVETKKILEKVRILTSKALTVYHEIFDDESGQCSLIDRGKFASDFVNNISGLRAPTRIQSANFNYHLTTEELDTFKKRGIEAARSSGMIVDVDYEDVKDS